MKQYRVVKYIGEREEFFPQRRFLIFFWKALRPELCFTLYKQAEDVCICDGKTRRRQKLRDYYVNAHIN